MNPKQAIKSIIYGCLDSRLARDYALRRLAGSALIPMYHGVIPDSSEFSAWTLMRESMFDAQMQFLVRHYIPVTLEDALGGKFARGKTAVAVTFDDGLKNNLDVALPILEKYGIPATVYISTSAIEQRQPFWWDKVIMAVQASGCDEIGPKYGLANIRLRTGNAEQRWTDVHSLLTALIETAYPDREILAEQIATDLLGADYKVAPEFQVMDIGELRQLAASPLISIGVHTHTHDLLTRLDAEAIRKTVLTGQQNLVEWLGGSIEHFAYPGGDHNQAVVDVIRELQFTSAVTTESGVCRPDTNPLRIPRLSMGAFDMAPFWRARLCAMA